MSRLLEILGRAITFNVDDLIWQWFNAVKLNERQTPSAQYQQLDRAIELIGDMKIDAAQEQLNVYLAENPSCVRGRLAAAAIYLQQGRLQNAVTELNSVYQHQPNNTIALYTLGHCFERLGQEPKAVEFYQDCLKFKNHLQLPRQRLAAIYFKNNQLDKTIEEYEILKDEYPDDISTLVMLGYLYIANAQYAKAVETFNTAILIHPDNFHADNHLDQLVRSDQLHEAIEHLDNLLSKQPERADLLAKRADILGMLGAAEEAVSQYEEALRICPNFLETTIKLGTQYLQMQQEQLAAQQFNRAVEINDQIVEAYVGLATAQKLAGNSSDALATLSLAAAIQPNSSLLFAETATLQFKINLAEDSPFCDEGNSSLNLIDAVIAAHQRQITVSPQNPDLHYRLGILMVSIGRISEAVQCFQNALKINPLYTRARTKLAVCLFEVDQKQAALEQLTESQQLDKDTLELHYQTALLYCDKIKFASSLINLQQQMENNFTSTDAAVNISIVLQNLSLLDRAAIMWENLSDTTAQAANNAGNTF
jgi:tetratricopeptide (TPR) repeat protein